jgi:hypothetical protein
MPFSKKRQQRKKASLAGKLVALQKRLDQEATAKVSTPPASRHSQVTESIKDVETQGTHLFDYGYDLSFR